MPKPGLTFKKATKTQVRARICLEGPSGSGKTWTALTLARGLGERVAMVDTEHRSASLYADEFDFDVLELDSYHPQTLIDALAAAGAAGYDVFVVDSWSHFWQGAEGMLEQVNNSTKRSGASSDFWGGWKDMAPLEQAMFRAILSYPGHIITTLRQKTEWIIGPGRNGTQQPQRVGMKAIQRDGIEYEFTVVATMDLDHNFVVTKTRCPLLTDVVITKPTEAVAKTLLSWLDDGKPDDRPSIEDFRSAIVATGSRAELDAVVERIKTAGMVNAAVAGFDGQGTTLRELVLARWHQLAPQRQTEPQPEPVHEPVPTHDDPAPAGVGHDESWTASPAQIKRIQTLFGKAGIQTDDDKHGYMTTLADRPITSTKDLTRAEYDLVCTSLQQAIEDQNTEAPSS